MRETNSAMTSHGDLNAPVLDFDPFSKEFMGDPHPSYELLRESGAVCWLPKYRVWAMGRYADVASAFEDWKTYSSAHGTGLSHFGKEKPWRAPSIIVEADPPLHTASRSALVRVLSPVELRKRKPIFMQDAETLINGLLDRGEFDAVTELAEIYASKMMGDSLGIPVEGREEFIIKYGAMATAALGPRNWIFEKVIKDLPSVSKWIAKSCERSTLAPGGFGALLYEASDRGELSADDAGLLIRSTLTAGIDNVILALGNMILALARNPAQWEKLQNDPTLWRTAFDEAMRYDTPVQLFFRTTTRTVTVGNVEIGADEKVALFMGSANRDPRKWERPTEFDITRNTNGHLALGGGIHACVGQMMARLEAECVLMALLKRVKTIELAGEPEPLFNNLVKGYHSIPVRVTLQ